MADRTHGVLLPSSEESAPAPTGSGSSAKDSTSTRSSHRRRHKASRERQRGEFASEKAAWRSEFAAAQDQLKFEQDRVKLEQDRLKLEQERSRALDAQLAAALSTGSGGKVPGALADAGATASGQAGHVVLGPLSVPPKIGMNFVIHSDGSLAPPTTPTVMSIPIIGIPEEPESDASSTVLIFDRPAGHVHAPGAHTPPWQLAAVGPAKAEKKEKKEKKDKKQKTDPGPQMPPPEDDAATGPPGGGEVAEEIVEIHEVATDHAGVDEVWDTEAADAEAAAAAEGDEIAEWQPEKPHAEVHPKAAATTEVRWDSSQVINVNVTLGCEVALKGDIAVRLTNEAWADAE